jgi:hypothetical protein
MSPDAPSSTAIERVSIDDIRHRAVNVKSQALSEAKGAVDEVLGESGVRTLVIVAGLVVVAASLAFFLGSRTASARMAEEFLGE